MMTKYSPKLQEMIDCGAVPLHVPPFPTGCQNCGDCGHVYVYRITDGPLAIPAGKYFDNGPSGPGWYTGQMEADYCPVCANGRRAEYLKEKSGMKGAELQVMLENLKTSGQFANKKAAIDAAAWLIDRGHGYMTLWGGYGHGKSTILHAIANAFRLRDVEAVYTTLADLLQEIKERFGDQNGGTKAEEVAEQYLSMQVLCIDEIEQVNLTPWARETIFRLLDTRYRMREDTVTVLAMNKRPDQLPDDLRYLASRMSGGAVVEVGGPDLRPAKGIIENREPRPSASRKEVFETGEAEVINGQAQRMIAEQALKMSTRKG